MLLQHINLFIPMNYMRLTKQSDKITSSLIQNKSIQKNRETIASHFEPGTLIKC